MFLEEDTQLSKVQINDMKIKSSLIGNELSTTTRAETFSEDSQLNTSRIKTIHVQNTEV